MSITHKRRSIDKVAVIGSGQIGPDIALFFAKTLSAAGVTTVIVDVSQEALERGRAKLEKKIAKGVESGAFSQKLQERMLGHVTFTNDYESIRGADLVIEAATEDAALKQRIFGQVESLAAPGAILASNSSHLEPEVIFEPLRDKARCAVVHYFFPAERNVVIEVVPGRETDPATSDWLLSFYESIGKVPIPVRSRYGYAVDPVFEGLFLASLLLADAGVATSKQIDAVATRALGLRVGPFTAMNLTGGTPITAVGLKHYAIKIHSWFRVPQSLADRAVSGEPWETPQRGETIDVPEPVEARVTEALRGAYFGLAAEIVAAGLASIGDLDMALELALDIKPPFGFMNRLGTAEALRLVQAYADENPGFPVPACLVRRGATNTPFDISVIQRRDLGDVAVLTIRRPKVLNALDRSVYDELLRRVDDIESDPDVKAIVLTGFGRKAFVAGADVRFLSGIQSAAAGEKVAVDAQKVVQRVADLSKPVVCALNGFAFGGGLELAMACTVRIAAKGLRPLAGQPETNLGIIPGAGGTQRLPRLIGFERAAEMLRTGRPIDAAEAVEIGLVLEQVEGDLVERAVQLAAALADGSVSTPGIPQGPMTQVPDALSPVNIGHRSRRVDEILCKAILEGARTTLTEGLAIEARSFGEACAAKDMRIGVENFLKNGPRIEARFVHA